MRRKVQSIRFDVRRYGSARSPPLTRARVRSHTRTRGVKYIREYIIFNIFILAK